MNNLPVEMEDFFGEARMRDVMVDLETMSVSPHAAIVSFGAVSFDMSRLVCGERFYTTINLESCVKFGRTIDAGTVKWWLKQSQDARNDILGGRQHTLDDALRAFESWLDEHTLARNMRCIWGNGADFDCVILRESFKACGMNEPWLFKNNRCFRTLKSLWPNIEPPAAVGTHHNALDDAQYQVDHLFKIRAMLRSKS